MKAACSSTSPNDGARTLSVLLQLAFLVGLLAERTSRARLSVRNKATRHRIVALLDQATECLTSPQSNDDHVA